MLAISLGQIFHLNSFKNPFWDFTHAVINNAFLVLMSNGWVWENLIKVQTGFTSFLNPFRTFLNIFAALSQDFGAYHKSRPKKKKSHHCYKLLSHSCHNHWVVFKPHKTTHCVATNTMRHLFCIVLLGNLPSHPCLNICEMESNPKYDTGSQSCCCFDCRLCCGAWKRLPSDPLVSGHMLFTKLTRLNWCMGNPVSWGVAIFIFFNPRDWDSSSIITHHYFTIIINHQHLVSHLYKEFPLSYRTWT